MLLWPKKLGFELRFSVFSTIFFLEKLLLGVSKIYRSSPMQFWKSWGTQRSAVFKVLMWIIAPIRRWAYQGFYHVTIDGGEWGAGRFYFIIFHVKLSQRITFVVIWLDLLQIFLKANSYFQDIPTVFAILREFFESEEAELPYYFTNINFTPYQTLAKLAYLTAF